MKKLFVSLFLFVFAMGLSAVASAQSDLKFEPSEVYFDESKALTISGTFINNGPDNCIVDDITLRIYVPDKDGAEKLISQATFKNVSIDVPKDASIIHKFRITGVKSTELEGWKVNRDITLHCYEETDRKGYLEQLRKRMQREGYY